MLMVVIDQVAKVPHQETKGAQNYSNRASHLFNFFFLILRFKKEEQSVKNQFWKVQFCVVKDFKTREMIINA